jgi:hypothetical protein
MNAGIEKAEGPGTSEQAAHVPERDLFMEAHVTAVSIWYRVWAAAWFLGILGTLWYLRSGAEITSEQEAGIKITVILVFALANFFYLMGHALAGFGAGARTVAQVVNILSFFLCIYILANLLRGAVVTRHRAGWVLVTLSWMGWFGAVGALLRSDRCKKVCSEDYRLAAARDKAKPPLIWSPFFFAPLAGTVLFAVAGVIWWLVKKG